MTLWQQIDCDRMVVRSRGRWGSLGQRDEDGQRRRIGMRRSGAIEVVSGTCVARMDDGEAETVDCQ